jgi:GNAT superfamily N-acetyltransferase
VLTATDWEQVKMLQTEVEQTDGISLKLNWDTLRNRRPEENNDFVYREDGHIIAFLGVYEFGSKIEVCGMVAPKFRRQGIFTKLLQAALPQERIMQYREILFNTPAKSISGQAFLASIGAVFSITEYQMKYNASSPHLEINNSALPMELRPATSEDKDDLIALDVQGFDLPEGDVIQMYNARAEETESITYVIQYKSKTAGKLRCNVEHEESWVYGFVVYEHLRGLGIGRAALMSIVQQEQAKGHNVYLEVALNNERALNLYTSCGFEHIHAQDYYMM